MSTEEIQAWLQEGVAAANAGDHVKAREFLTRVVSADEGNLPAWLWLSSVAATLEDREVCLENVLALDPSNAAAQRSLAEVRAQIEATPEIEPESPLPHLEVEPKPETRVAVDFTNSDFSDPLLCVYCAQLTRETDQRCQRCKRKLYQRFYENDEPRWIWMGWTVNIAEAIFMTIGLTMMLGVIAAALSITKYGGREIELGQLLSLYFGQPTTVPLAAQKVVLAIMPHEQFYLRLIFVVFDVIIAFGLLTRKRPFHVLYIGGLAVAAVLVYFNMTADRVSITGGAPPTSPIEGVLQVALSEALGVLVILLGGLFGLFLLIKVVLAFAMENDFATKTERLWCMIDQTIREANGAFIRAKSYMKRDMWTLAAMYLQRAVSLQPSTVEYYLALAECNARLGRYVYSLNLLNQAEKLQPDSPVIPNLRGVIMELNARATSNSTGDV